MLATTGLPPAQIMRLTPADVDLQQRTVYVRPRRKGAGAPGRTLPLSADAVAAFRAFIAADAWGRYSSRSAATSFARAVAKAKAETLAKGEAWAVPEGFRAYDLRHSFLTMVYAQTKDINAAAELGVHAGFATTRRYVEAAVSATAKAAIAAIQELPSVLPAGTGTSRQNPRKRGTSAARLKTKKPARSRG